MKKLSFWRLALATAGLWLAAGALPNALAQPTSGGPSPGTPTIDPTETPIDGGASLLLAAGIGFGLKRLRQCRKTS